MPTQQFSLNDKRSKKKSRKYKQEEEKCNVIRGREIAKNFKI